MRLDELSHNDENNLNFDIVDDMHVFMKNDPMFYRKEYYPTMCSIPKKANKQTKKVLMSLVNKAAKIYCKKYNIPLDAHELIGLDKRRDLITKIQSEEMPRISAGEYS